MINKDDLIDVFNEEGVFLKDQLYLYEWDVRPYAGKLSKGVRGQCDRQTPYRRATITLDPTVIDSKAEARRVLRHELIHLVMARIWRADTVAAPYLPKKARKAFRRMLSDVEEELVGHVEAILDIGIGAPLKSPRKKRRKKKRKKR